MMVSLRPMTTADLPAVLRLEQALFPRDPWPERFFHEELSATPEAPDSPERHATRRYWVAEVAPGAGSGPGAGSDTEPQAELVGYAGMMCVLPLADVQTIAVADSAQGTGLGTRLMRRILETARDLGAEQVLLEVREDNPRAQAFYRREGFVHIHTRRRYYPDGEDALIMRRALKDLRAPTSASDLRSR